MNKNAEITVAIQNGNPSITIHISAQEDGETKLILRDMLSEIQEAITEFQAKPQAKLLPSAAAEVHDAPCIQPPAEEALPGNEATFAPQRNASKPKANPASSGRGHQNGSKKITLGQISTIRQNLQERRIPESTFCRMNHVERIEDLSKGVAWNIIHDHRY